MSEEYPQRQLPVSVDVQSLENVFVVIWLKTGQTRVLEHVLFKVKHVKKLKQENLTTTVRGSGGGDEWSKFELNLQKGIAFELVNRVAVILVCPPEQSNKKI